MNDQQIISKPMCQKCNEEVAVLSYLGKLIGLTCYTQLEKVRKAQQDKWLQEN